jgi:hypothetical protein
MPRPPEPTRNRRLLMQSIMWIILGGTIGLAALVDQRRHSSLNADLGEPQQFKGFSIRLPADWTPSEEQQNPKALVELQEPNFGDEGRMLSVTLKQWSPLTDAISVLTSGGDSGTVQREETIPMGETTGTLQVQRILRSHPMFEAFKYPVTVVTASRRIPGDKILLIELDPQGARSSKKELQRDIDLMKRIAATVKVDATP